MKAMTKYLTGAAAAAALTLTVASPAQAQYRYDRDRGIDAGDVIAGVAVVAGIAGLIAALDGNNNRYRDDRYNRGYDNRGYGYGNAGYGNAGYGNVGYGNAGYGYDSAQAAVNACARQAQRVGQNVQITDLDRTNRGFRVRGRVDVAGYDGRGWNRRYDVDRERFTCYAANGRIYDFRV